MSKREIVAREIRRAMLDNPTDGGFNARAAQREKIADQAADAILTALAAQQDGVREELAQCIKVHVPEETYRRFLTFRSAEVVHGSSLEQRGDP